MTTARMIDGRAIAARIRGNLKTSVAEFVAQGGQHPGLATILIGRDPASEVYVANKRRQATEVGMLDLHVHLEETVSRSEVEDVITSLASDSTVSGILLQLPLPGRMESGPLIDLIPAEKDVDGLTTLSAGLLARGAEGLRPCTPQGILELLKDTGVPLAGARAVIVGRSALVGAPLALMLTQHDATVTVAHSRTQDLATITREADFVIAAAGRHNLITKEHVRPGAVVIDVGIHRTPNGLQGDVDFRAVSQVAGWITPVPGGVGPMTIAMLLNNTLIAARRLQAKA